MNEGRSVTGTVLIRLQRASGAPGALVRLRASLRLLALLVATSVASVALAETVVYGRVVAVEPMPGSGAAERSAVVCPASAPEHAAGLLARLRWDLEQRALERARCLASRAAERYRVTYQWNGQLFTQELPFDPGERIALRLEVH